MAVEEGEIGGGLLSNLTPRQRMVAIGSFAVIIVLLVALVVLLMGQKGEDKYVVIVRDMPHKSVGEAIEHLKEKQIPYEIRDEGTSIAVAREKKEEAIISLAMEGLPKDGKIGFEIFGDKSGGMISTDFEKKVALQRAMNGELSRIIARMDGVEDAQVMIVVPEPQLFQEQQLPTTASVLIKFANKGGFNQEQIDAITHLIASSVPGLKPNNVTVTDTDGNMLAAGQGTSETEAGKFSKEMAKQLEIRRDMESKYEAKIVDLLEKIVGPGHVKARVSLDVNFDAIQRRKREMEPVVDKDGNPLPVAEKVLRERSSEPKYREGGVVGVTANTQQITNPQGQQQQVQGTAAVIPAEIAKHDKDTEQRTINFNNTEELVTPAMGEIRKISASVTYQYGMPTAGEEGGEEEGALRKLQPQEIEELVKAAVGFVDQRDRVSVKEVVFDDTLQKLLAEQMAKQEAAKKMIPWWIALVAGVLALIIGAGIGGALLAKKPPPPEAAGFGGGIPGGEYAAVPIPGGAPPGGAIPAPEGGPEVAAPQDKVEVSRAPVTPPPDNPFGFLYGLEAETVANLLSSERLPTLVAVLAQLDPAQADEVINLLNPEIQSEVRSRLANNPVLPPMTQKMVSQSLKKRLQAITATV